MTSREAPYGSWTSPISAASVAEGAHPVDDARFVGDEIWWSERRPTEGGRTTVFARPAAGGALRELLSAPDSVRSRVHEYGGGAWTATDAGELVHVDGKTQQVLLTRLSGARVALTPAAEGVSYGDLGVQLGRLLAIRETLVPVVRREVVEIPLDGSGALDPAAVVILAGGSQFSAHPRLSPDGSRLARIAWDHPQMAWDGTRLEVDRLTGDDAGRRDVLLGGDDESVLQPEWRDAETLLAVTDRSGFWNPVVVDLAGRLSEWSPIERDTGGALWNLGLRSYLPADVPGGDTVLRSTFGEDRIELMASDGSRRILETPFTWIELLDRRGDEILVHAGSSVLPGALCLLDVSIGAISRIREDIDDVPETAWLPRSQQMTLPSAGREVHVVFSPPTNPDFRGPVGELPPVVALVHGGPTAHTQASVDLAVAYYTSRGIGVVDVNYGGSTGYGRAYRERLRGRWGIVDVEDVEAAVRGLVVAGLADPQRLAIEGGSAGGWTVLGALVRGEVFACGVSRYGVADLEALQAVTHDFESHYNDSLVGPFAEDPDVWRERSPLTRAAELDKPVLLLQGLDDPVVPPSQSEAFRDALVEAEVPHAYLTFEGEGHGFRRSETKQRVREAALSFYGQIFGFPTDVPRLELWRGGDAEGLVAGDPGSVPVDSSPTPAPAPADYATERARRHDAVAGPTGPLALVNTQVVDSEQPIWGVKGTWAPVPGEGTGLLLTASAEDGILVDGELVDGTVVVAGAEAANPSSIRFDANTVGRVIPVDGGSTALRVFDARSDAIASFGRIDAFDPDPAWVLTGTFEPADDGATAEVEHVSTGPRTHLAAGTVRVRVDGAEVEFLAFPEGDELRIVFSDATNGDTSYSVGRFLHLVPDQHGTVVVDFNRAVLPPCAFSYHFNCPIPPRQNRLSIPVPAGEKIALSKDGDPLHY